MSMSLLIVMGTWLRNKSLYLIKNKEGKTVTATTSERIAEAEEMAYGTKKESFHGISLWIPELG